MPKYQENKFNSIYEKEKKTISFFFDGKNKLLVYLFIFEKVKNKKKSY